MSKMSNSRLSDDSIFSDPGESGTAPKMVGSLLTRLGLSRASEKDREQGIQHWLQKNSPSETLKKNLIKNGYEHLLHLPA
ncbi:hypothetical protein ACH49M_21330 [Rhodococcus qingshengii]|uniref:hypothetical protein n=1 Tax=Rhodococcus qingshengii TaxID=334542 RepID=UPI0036F6CAB8